MSFNTCSSCEEQQSLQSLTSPQIPFQYMLLLRGATLLERQTPFSYSVSIHAPLARSNGGRCARGNAHTVSIHAPLARSNFVRIPNLALVACFNTCSSCEEQPGPRRSRVPGDVSIHAPLARSNMTGLYFTRHYKFQYMLLLRGAT